MKFHIKEYQTGWNKGWEQTAGGLNLDAHAPSRVVLRATEPGDIRLSPRVKPGGRSAAIPCLNGREVPYDQEATITMQAGDKLTLEARLEENKDQCWNYWALEGASIVLRNPLAISFWEGAHLGDSLGMMIACENFAKANQVSIEIRSTPLFQAIHKLFIFDHVTLAPASPEMIHVHPFGYEFETLGWIQGVAKALSLATGGRMPDQVTMPRLGRKRHAPQEEIVLCQFDSRSGGVWPKQTILDFLKRYHDQRVAVLGGPDTSHYLGDAFEYRLGDIEFLVDQLLSCKRFVGVDSGIAHLACILGLEIEVVPSPAVSRKLAQGVFQFYPRPPKFTDVKTSSHQNRAGKRLLLVSTTNGWNLGDDLIRQGVMRLLNVGPLDPVIWLNRAQVNVPDSDRKCSWSPLWKKL
ncbi:MAG TPA: hypothetical protein PLB55_18040, partial [Prosthecobacter sp.]|nr:hypothetical protein [Prosthecobacter sp.]